MHTGSENVRFIQGKRFVPRTLNLSPAFLRDHASEGSVSPPHDHYPVRKRRSIKAQFFSPPHRYLPVDWDKSRFVPRVNYKLSSRWVKVGKNLPQGRGILPLRGCLPRNEDSKNTRAQRILQNISRPYRVISQWIGISSDLFHK